MDIPKTIQLFGRTLTLHEKGFYETEKTVIPHLHVQPYPDMYSGSVDMGAVHTFEYGNTLQDLEKNIRDKLLARVASYQAVVLELGVR